MNSSTDVDGYFFKQFSYQVQDVDHQTRVWSSMHTFGVVVLVIRHRTWVFVVCTTMHAIVRHL